MANYQQVSDETKKIFMNVVNNTSIPQFVEFELLCNNKQKKKVCKLWKSNDIVETLTNGINFAIIVNEDIFNELTPEQQRIAFDECLAGISVNDNDVISVEGPDFTTYSGVLRKYGQEDVIVFDESVKSLYNKKKIEEEERKAANKGKRGRPKKNI